MTIQKATMKCDLQHLMQVSMACRTETDARTNGQVKHYLLCHPKSGMAWKLRMTYAYE